jgi:Holliday junction resolvasome RuvABC endonuclease subunit
MPIVIPLEYGTYRLIGIDPGLNFTGVAIYDIDYSTGVILRIEAFTLNNDRLKDLTGFDPDQVTERTIKLYKLKQAIQYVLREFNPSYVVCEAPFYNRFMPMAYGALMEVVCLVQSSVLEWNSNIGFHTVPPLSVKKMIGTKAVKNDTLKGKDLVKTAVGNVKVIMDVLVTPLQTLSEHAIDAIAVGYTLINREG